MPRHWVITILLMIGMSLTWIIPKALGFNVTSDIGSQLFGVVFCTWTLGLFGAFKND